MGGFYTDDVPHNTEDVHNHMSDAAELRALNAANWKFNVGAARAHLVIAANSAHIFNERLSRLRSAWLTLAVESGCLEGLGRLELLEFDELRARYNDVRAMLASSLYPRSVGVLLPAL